MKTYTDEYLLSIDLVDLRKRLKQLGWKKLHGGVMVSFGGQVACIPAYTNQTLHKLIVRDILGVLAKGDYRGERPADLLGEE